MTIDPVSIGISLALSAANMALQASRRIEGPRLEDTKFNAADYGGLLTRFWGTRWIVPKVIFGEDLREEKHENKTKGGKYNDYTYFGTWAVLIAPHPIDKVTRVKMDGHLVLDLTGAGPITPFDLGGVAASGLGKGEDGGSLSGNFTDYFRVYTGAPGQEPDERMLATIEALHGVGSCPDYRGRSWAMIENLPLEKFGNRIPQIELEAVTLGEPNHTYESFEIHDANLSRLWGATFSPDYSRFMWLSNDYFEIWDVAARTRMSAGPLSVPLTFQGPVGIFADGGWLATDSVDIYQMGSEGFGANRIYEGDPGDVQFQGARVVVDGYGTEHWCGLALLWLTPFVFDGVLQNTLSLTGDSWTVTTCFTDFEGSVWVGGGETGSLSTTCHFYRMVAGADATGPDHYIVGGLIASGASSITVNARANAAGFVFAWGTHELYIAQRDGTLITADPSILIDSYNIDTQIVSAMPGASTMWIQNKEVSLTDLSVVRTVDLDDWTTEPADGIVYDPINHALITSPANDTKITWRYLDRLVGGSMTLQTIVEDVCELAGLDLATIDATALTQPIVGYSVAGGTGKDWLEPLLDLYDVDPRPHGFKLQFVNRGASASVTIDSEDFAAGEDGDAPFTHTRPGATDVPAYLSLQFADPAIDQQRNSTLSGPRGKADGVKPANIDMTSWVAAVDAAQQLGQRLHRRMAFDAGGISLALPSRQIALEPADLRVLSLRGHAVPARLVSIEMRADRRFATEWKRDDPSVAVLSGAEGASADGNVPQTIVVPVISKGFVLDVPLLADAEAATPPRVYVLAAPFATGAWPGAAMFQAVDGEYTDQLASLASSAPATWGTASLLPEANCNLWDRGSSITVAMQYGTLVGTTEALCDANPRANLAAIGAPGRWEIVQFTTATLTAPNTYAVSGFKRGRRGTEWAAPLHADSDQFVLLSNAAPAALGLSEVGTDLSFKAVTNGRSLSGAFPIDLAPFTGASLKPYAPCHLHAAKQSNGDWVLAWVRRTRVGGAWTSGTTIPLGEASEVYELVLGDGVDTVTKTVTAATTYTWTQAAQVTDLGAEVMAGGLEWSAFQISDAVGRGFEAELAA